MENMQLQKQRGNPNWKPGVSGNPAGRPMQARQIIGEKMIRDIATLWEEGGTDVLRNLMADDPATFARLAFGLLPKEQIAKLEVSQAQSSVFTPDELTALHRVLDVAEATGAPRETFFAALDTFLRSELARPIETLPELEVLPALPPPCPIALPGNIAD
jgi:hypothetical protein